MTLFLSVTAVPGAVMLVLGAFTPPTDMLRESFFRSFTVPGLTLAVVVGGSAVLAAVQLIRRRPIGAVCAAAAGVFVMAFEFLQVVSIGSPAGPSRVMQLLYFALGALLGAVSVATRRLTPRPDA
jgi:hypothetical protein